MDLRKIKKLIELVEESGIAELEVSAAEESVRIVMGTRQHAVQVGRSTVQQSPAGPRTRVLAPMAGTFYRAPDPGAKPFVEIGQSVAAGDVLCIIESMKMMHEIHAAEAGTVVEIAVPNGVPVNTGDLLFALS